GHQVFVLTVTYFGGRTRQINVRRGTGRDGPSWCGVCGTALASWPAAAGKGSSGRCRASFAWEMTMVFVTVGWVLFRAADFQTAVSILVSLAGSGGFGRRLQTPALIVIAALVSVLVPSTHEIKKHTPDAVAVDRGCGCDAGRLLPA